MSKIKNILLKWHHAPLWQKIMVALMLGMFTGIFFGESATVLKPIGDAFIHALHMVVVPVILTAVVTAVTHVVDYKQMGRITLKAFVIYLAFLIIATIIAIAVGNLLQPGVGLTLPNIHNHYNPVNLHANPNVNHVPAILDIFVEMIPSNPVASFVNANILQIVVFGLLLGVAINLSGESGKPVAILFESMSKVSMQLTQIVMSFAPYGVFALISWTFGLFGPKALLPLLNFIFSLSLSCFILVGVIYAGIITFILNKSAAKFFKNIIPAMTFAVSTTSSGATLPVSMRCAEEGLAISPKITKFMLPLGCNFNLAGLAMYLTTAVIFTANMHGISLSITSYITLISTVVLTTMGTGAIPGSGVVVMSAVISTMGMPLAALPLIAGIDRINDMIQTTTNVISDIFAAYLVAETENKYIDEAVSDKIMAQSIN